MVRPLLIFTLGFLVMTNLYAGSCDTAKLYFKTGEWQVGEHVLQSVKTQLEENFINKNINISITGYADYVGEETANQSLSQKRADAVAEWFFKNGWKKSDILVIAGMGEVAETGDSTEEGNPINRRVDIVPYGKVDISWLPESIFFLQGLDTVKPDNLAKLDTLLTLMKTNPCLKISIEGHTCCTKHEVLIERPEYTTPYSANSISRARIIRDFLLSKSIESERMFYTAYGTERPLYHRPKNDKEHAMNCRVAIRVAK